MHNIERESSKNISKIREIFLSRTASRKVSATGRTFNASTYIVISQDVNEAGTKDWFEVIIRGLLGQASFFEGEVLVGSLILEYSTDLQADWAEYGNFPAIIYNSIGGAENFTFLLSKKVFEQTGQYPVAVAQGTFTPGRESPWINGDFYLGNRTRP